MKTNIYMTTFIIDNIDSLNKIEDMSELNTMKTNT